MRQEDYEMGVTKKQHYVPQFYLRGFSEASGTLTSSVCASRADRTVSCVFADLRLALRVVSGSHFVTGIIIPL